MATAAAETSDGLVGQTLDGRYMIESVLGEGGLGRVYRGRHLKLSRSVAIKVLLEEFRQMTDIAQRFEREAQALSALNHPNIVTVTDFGTSNGVLYLVMELVQGDDLDTVIERDGALPIKRAVGIVIQILRSLAYAHEQGIIHRDLKLANVHVRSMPDGSEHVEVLDFGLAKFLEQEKAPTGAKNMKLTQAGTIMGTPAYMAPEQVDGASCDARTDVYAVGVMLFELLTSRLPFVYQDPASMLRAHLVEEVPKVRSLRDDVPPDLEDIICKAMAKAPAGRFDDGAAMLTALENAELEPIQESVTGRIKIMSEVLTENVERLSGEVAKKAMTISSELHLPERFEGLRSKLPEPLRKLPLSVLGAMVGGVLLVVVIVTFVGISMTDSPRPVAALPSGLLVLPEGADLNDLEQLDDLPDARDPFAVEEEIPADLLPLKRRLDQGGRRGRLRRGQIGTLRAASVADESDCRPVLLHARAYVAKRWLSQALPLYEEVFRRDPSCRGDPHMLEDLVMMAATATLEREAAAVVIRVYGDEADDAIEAAIEGVTGSLPRDQATRARLARLGEML